MAKARFHGSGAHRYHEKSSGVSARVSGESSGGKSSGGKSPKIHKVMHEFKHGELHSGSKKGPMVKSRKQAVAIALSEARRGKKS